MAKKPTKAFPRRKPVAKKKAKKTVNKKHHLYRERPKVTVRYPSQSKHLTPKKLGKFLEYYMQNCNVYESCRRAGIHHVTVNNHKRKNANFKKAFEEARAIAFENLESEAFRRAFAGTDKPVFSFGQVCGHIREYSDTLTIFLLKGNKKELYGDSLKLGGDGAEPIRLEYTDRDSAVEEILAFLTGGKTEGDAGPDSEET